MFLHFAIDLEGDQLNTFSCPHSKMGTTNTSGIGFMDTPAGVLP